MNTPPALPSEPWDLPAPDSHVLLNGPDRPDAEPFRLAVMELVGKRHLRMMQVEEPGLLGTKRRSVLVAGDERTRPEAESLLAVWNLYYEPRTQTAYRKTYKDGTTGVELPAFARAAAEYFGSLQGYAAGVVVPSLIKQGLMEKQAAKILWLIPTTRIVLTPAGVEKRRQLQEIIWLAQQQAGSWAGGGMGMGMESLMFAGAAMLLMPAMFPHGEGMGASAWDFQSMDQFGQDWGAGAMDSGGGGDWGGDGGGGFDGGGGDGGGGDGGGGGC